MSIGITEPPARVRKIVLLLAAVAALMLGGLAYSEQASAYSWNCFYPQNGTGSPCTSHALLSGSSGWSSARSYNWVKLSNFSSTGFDYQIWMYNVACVNNSICKFPSPTTSYHINANTTAGPPLGNIVCPPGGGSSTCKALIYITSSGSYDVSMATSL
jgi:hypothetical protein